MKKRDDGWISITQAALALRMRYQRARDLATMGRLGEVRRTPTGRYYVREKAVQAFAEARATESDERAHDDASTGDEAAEDARAG